jgi:glutaredoxin 3
MAEVVIYTRGYCHYCDSAKKLLDSKGVEYSEVSLDEDPEKLKEMIERSNRRTVPQIFIDGKSIGGFDDLNALERAGELDKLLGK